jgi:DNA-binding response OmpR family regulator
MQRLLIVDDDLATCAAIKSFMHDKFEIKALYDGSDLEEEVRRFLPDLILLDINLPGRNGLVLLRDLGEMVQTLPVFMISVRGGDEDIVRAFDLGAADYITKPFSLEVLRARLQRWLGKAKAENSFSFDQVSVDLQSGRVTGPGRTEKLTRKELLTLRFMLANEGQVVSRQQILGFAWGYDYDGTPRTVDNTIASLRRKLGDSSLSPRLFISNPGLGYCLLQARSAITV